MPTTFKSTESNVAPAKAAAPDPEPLDIAADGQEESGDGEAAPRPQHVQPRALLVEDDPDSLELLVKLVERENFSVLTAGSLKEARARIHEQPADVIFVDLVLPDGDGMDLLREYEDDADASAEIVMVTGHASVDSAIESLRRGAVDYLTKPIDIPRLKTILANVARTRELKGEIGALRAQLRTLGHFGPLVGVSPPMQRVYDLMSRVAPTEATVLITGETGTGKDVTAATVHQLSRRRGKPFLALNCGAVSPNLIESELFGHERGSFTGADRAHRGYFERASGGTLFLDEIAEMPVELQVKLLRVLETGSVTRIGGERSIEVNVRVIAATNRRLEDAVSEGKLREDLLYRLKVFLIHLPALRERAEDIEILTDHFLDELNKAEGVSKYLTREVLGLLRSYSWPGNVRELKNVIHGATILAEQAIAPECLPPEILAATQAAGTEAQPAVLTSAPSLHVRVGTSIADAERRLILATLNETRGDKRRSAQILGISLKTLYNRLNAYKEEHEARSFPAASLPVAAAEELASAIESG